MELLYKRLTTDVGSTIDRVKTFDNLMHNTDYKAWVEAVNSVGQGPWSNEVTFRTPFPDRTCLSVGIFTFYLLLWWHYRWPIDSVPHTTSVLLLYSNVCTAEKNVDSFPYHLLNHFLYTANYHITLHNKFVPAYNYLRAEMHKCTHCHYMHCVLPCPFL